MYKWFKKRNYRHFDLPVDDGFACKVMNPDFVKRHSFSPMIHYEKIERKYKKEIGSNKRKLTKKERPIKYSSHQDACILSYYSYVLNERLESVYGKFEISDFIIAYRSLGRSNYDFSAEAMRYAIDNAPVCILAFDVKGFFDNINHSLLKKRMKRIMEIPSLSDDWYKIYKYMTKFSYIDLEDLKGNALFKGRLEKGSCGIIATMSELKREGIKFHQNANSGDDGPYGIPQGTPMSAVMSNLYMIDFDIALGGICRERQAFYRRYSDDILIICNESDSKFFEAEVKRLVENEKLKLSEYKTEKTCFSGNPVVSQESKAAQYLGFSFHESGPAIRESSLAKQWRKLKSAIRKAQKSARWRRENGLNTKIYTKKLYRRFSAIRALHSDGGRGSCHEELKFVRNFSSYARRSALAFGGNQKISRQILKFERYASKEIASLNQTPPDRSGGGAVDQVTAT